MPHEDFMREALKYARRGAGRTSPNPAVGAVIVKGGRVIAAGFHKKAGLPHAEIEALLSLGDRADKARGASMYVTLEPCRHFGRTPPCTEALISHGIKKVFIGAEDPNPLVSGKGIRDLERAGIEVSSGILEDECTGLNEAYNKYMREKTPFVTLKLAASLDGRIATAEGESRWITGTGARRRVHRMRSITDAVMVGSGTVIKDDPELTVRLASGRNPKRVVVDSSLRIPLDAKVFGKGGGLIIFTTSAAPGRKIDKARAIGAEVVVLPGKMEGVSIKRVLKELGKREITSVLIEGGARLAASAIKEGVVDRLAVFLSPTLIGAEGLPAIGGLGLKRLKDAFRLKEMSAKKIGGDILVEGRF